MGKLPAIVLAVVALPTMSRLDTKPEEDAN